MAIQTFEAPPPVTSASSWRESVAAQYAVVQARIQSKLEATADHEDYH